MWIFQPRLTEGIAVTVLKTVSLQNFCNEQNTTWFCNFIPSQHKTVHETIWINQFDCFMLILFTATQTPSSCEAGYFFCSSSATCVTKNKVCDGNADCSNGEDEENCGKHNSRLLNKVFDKQKRKFGVERADTVTYRARKAILELWFVCCEKLLF